MAILTGGGGRYSSGREYNESKKKASATPQLSNPYTLEQLSKDIHSGAVTNQGQLDAKLKTQGYQGNTEQNRVTVAPSAYRSSAPASIASSPSSYRGTTTVAGRTANSAGSFYGSAGQNTMATSFDSSGNPILGTLGNRNIIGGQGSRVDRTGGVPQDPMSQYMAMFSPTGAIDRQAQIRKDMARERQQQIDAIEMSAKQAVSAEQQAGAQDLARQRSMNLRAGLGGSDFGASAKAEVRNRTNQNIQGIEAQKQLQIGNAIDRIEQLAQSRFQIQQSAMQQGFQNMFQVQQYTQAQEQQMRAQTLDSLKELGKAGVDIQTVKEQDPQLYERMMQASGMSDVEMEAVLNNAKPAPERIDYQYKVAGNKLIAYGVDPVTGTLKSLEQTVDLPENYSITTMPDGTVLALPDNWNGDTSLIKTVGNYAKPVVAGGGGGGSGNTAQYASDMDAVIGNVLATIPTKFGQEQFQAQIKRARNDGDKLNIVAGQVLKAQPAEVRRDFANQSVGLSEIDKAINLIDSGVQTGVINNGAQYVYNVFGKDFDPKLAEINQHLVAAIQPYRNSVTGAAWGQQETDEYNQLFGSTKYSPAELKQRLVTLKDILKSKSATTLNAFANPLGYGDNMFQTGAFGSDTTGGTTVLLGPDGNQYEVPNDQVDAFLADGGKRL